MSLLSACEWLGHSWVGTTIRDSKWGFAVIEMVHLMALALLGGALLVTGLRLFGFFLGGQPPGIITRDLGRVLIGALTAMIVSGILLFADGPLRYYDNGAFRVKLLLLLAASATAWAAHLIAVRAQSSPAVSTTLKITTLVSLLLWLGVGIAGRVIGIL
jgi:hypothetical protein